MGIILDLVLIAIVLICIILTVKKGFVRSLVEVLGYILAIVIAFSVSGVAAEYIYDNMVEDVVIDSISTAIEENSEKALDSLPDYVVTLLDQTDFDVENAILGGNSDATTIAQQVSTDMLRPLAIGIFKTIISVLIFLVLMVVVKILARIINSFFKGAILGTANKVLGISLGSVKGLVFASIFSMIVYFVSTLSESDFLFFTSESIEASYITKYLIEFILGKF